MKLNFDGFRLGEAFPNIAFWLATLAFFGVLTLGALHYQAPSPVRFGVVDLSSIISAREKEFSDILLKKDANDNDRAKAFESVKRTSEELTQALAELRKSCDCNLLVAGALVAGNKDQIQDFTPVLKAALGVK